MQIQCVAPWVVMRAGMVRMGTRLLWREEWLLGDVKLVGDDAGQIVSETGWLKTCPRWVRRGVQPLWSTAWILRDDLATGTEGLSPSWAGAAEQGESKPPWVVVREVLLRAGIDLPSGERLASVVWPFARREDVIALDGRVARLERRLDAFEKRRAV